MVKTVGKEAISARIIDAPMAISNYKKSEIGYLHLCRAPITG